MKRNLLILVCALVWNTGVAQDQHKIDSLKLVLQKADSDAARCVVWYNLATEYMDFNNDSALYYIERQIATAEKMDIKLAAADGYDIKGYVLTNFGRKSEAFQLFRKALEMAGNPANETRYWNPEALGTPREVRLVVLAQIHIFLGYLMGTTDSPEQPMAHYWEAERLAREAGNYKWLGLAYTELGQPVHWNNNALDSALQFEQQALTCFTKAGYKKWMGCVYYTIGIIYRRKNDINSAGEYFQKAVQASLEANNSNDLYWSYTNLAGYYIDKQNKDSSLFYAQKMGEVLRLHATGLLETAERPYYFFLARSYEINHQTDSAYKYLNIAYRIQTRSNESRVKNLANVQNLSFQEQLRAEQLEKEKTALQNRFRQYALLGGLGMVLLVAFFLYRNNRQRQKANALLQTQNRELEIEAALERVRSRAMAMLKSEELGAIIFTLFQQLAGLNIKIVTSWVTLMDPVRNELTIWVAHIEGEAKPGVVKNTDFETFKQEMEDWKSGKDNFLAIPSEIARAQVKKIFGFDIHPPDGVPFWYLCQSWNQYGYIGLSTWAPPSEEEKKIVGRFSKMFEQTYTRFLDLQKAEAQTREAQIEAALEKVRSRMMAMHQTDELHEVLGAIFTQLQSLGLDAPGSSLIIYNRELAAEHWMTGFSGGHFPESYKIPYNEHPYFTDLLHAWQNGVPFQEFIFEGDLKLEYGKWCLEHSDFKRMPPEFKKEMVAPDRMVISDAFNKYGMIEILGPAPLPEESIDVLKRFSKVFEQTYTRFLDLQKAEAQTREAQTEVALERVRARSMAMRHSGELSEAAELLYNEFLKMGVESFSCGYLINDDEKQEWKIWLTNPGEPFFKEFWTCPYFADHNLQARYESWKRQEDFHCSVLEGEENRAHHVVISKYAPWKEAMLDSLPPRLVFNSAHFSLGHLLVIAPDRLDPELEQAMVRFAKVFDLTYRRFLDLEKAETRAREAKIEAGLDRVRAEIASMRNPEDLERITPLVWRELTTLEVPFFRCGVFIMDEKNQQVHTHLSTPDGKSLGVLQMTFDSAETIRKAVGHWRKQEIYLDNWSRQQFIDWVLLLTKRGYIREGKIYQGAEQAPESLALHFVPFKQGMLYVGHSERLSEAQIQLVQRLAYTFAVAYARYEDFIQLEAAKRQVETTLTELKSTQTQLIQSEKLASLGELTAGIAHEIQNPLNFVNNFSELSVDLAKELKEEVDKTAIPEKDKDYIGEILTDLTQNQQKINHHGKRAAAIVSGMLQHARSSTGTKEPTDINALADEYLRLAYHGLRAKDPNFNAKMVTGFDPAVGMVEVNPQDMGRVFLNLINNAFYAVSQKAKQGLGGYEPAVTVSTQKADNHIIVKIKDNGTGIPEDVKARIFQPFFTTKPTGQGTGLGLSLAYDIVTKGHGGEMKMESAEGEGTEFTLILPNQSSPKS